MSYQRPTSSNYLQPWSVVSDAELKLLRELRQVVSYQGGVTPEVHALLGKLRELPK